MSNVAINGLGRIGRATLKLLMDHPALKLVAVNDLAPLEDLRYLLRYDSVYGRYEKIVGSQDDDLFIEGERIKVFHEEDPAALPWKDLDIDLVFECTGQFTNREKLEAHLRAGAKKALLSAPSKEDDMPFVVSGVNTAGDAKMFSLASCTTGCVAPVIEIIGRTIGFKKSVMTTIHAYTSSQSMVDSPAKKPERGRAGAVNLVPTSTGAAQAATRVLPDYQGRFDGVAIRAPVPTGSIADLTFVLERATTVEEVNNIFRGECISERYQEVVEFVEEPIVSTDIIMDPRAAVVDLTLTKVVDGDLLKVFAWYDNEWGYAAQMVREGARVTQ